MTNTTIYLIPQTATGDSAAITNEIDAPAVFEFTTVTAALHFGRSYLGTTGYITDDGGEVQAATITSFLAREGRRDLTSDFNSAL